MLDQRVVLVRHEKIKPHTARCCQCDAGRMPADAGGGDVVATWPSASAAVSGSLVTAVAVVGSAVAALGSSGATGEAVVVVIVCL